MSHRLLILALAAPAVLLASCAGTATENRGLESAHQPVVSRTEYLFDMTTDYGRPSAGELQRLSGWLGSLRLGYGDKVALDDPAGSNSPARSDIAAVVARYGLFLADAVPISATPPSPGTVRVIITRTTAAVPTCPDNHDAGTGNFNAHTSSNYGCSINSNLAAMVAQPEDLVRGQPGAVTSDPATGTHAIQALRKGTGSGGTGGTTGAAGASGGGASTGGSSGGSSGGGSSSGGGAG
ncbi:CpaD family pilus assembly lipoprotein [Sphingomonas sp. 28-63-12]|uniref:CpaD family pilus assembly lipoprotein n=1 Tax=Sphingomonas sp. 28-63-12 TaxID=1970434 RepID=UPI000BD361AD|nr:MAG: hypothetical protein B7Y47_03360 [Sphingomonas sp. 28-63-12]